jgi:hypothetical protein
LAVVEGFGVLVTLFLGRSTLGDSALLWLACGLGGRLGTRFDSDLLVTGLETPDVIFVLAEVEEVVESASAVTHELLLVMTVLLGW